MGSVRVSLKWIAVWGLLALMLSGWMLRTESAGIGVATSTDVTARLKVTYSGLRLNRATQTYDTVATLTNTSTDTLRAPLDLHVPRITPATVTLANAMGTAANGHPYVTVPLPTGELAPGAKLTNVVLRFRNPANVKFTFTHEVFGALPVVNTPPVAHAGDNWSVAVGAIVMLDASRSTDVDGDTLSYHWRITDKPTASAAALSDASTLAPSLQVDKPGDYRIELIVNDGTLDSDPAFVTLSTLNVPPVANAGVDQTAPVGATLTLDGNDSFDDDDDPLTFAWTLAAQPATSTATLRDPASATPDLTLDRAGNYVAQLIVTDGTADSAPDTVTLSTLNSRPVADAGADQQGVTDESITLDGSNSSDALSFQWDLTGKPAGSAAELLDAELAVTAFTPDLAGDYVAQLIVSDGHLGSEPDTALIEISVATPPPEDVQITSAPLTTAIQGQAYQYDVEATDKNGRTLTYSLTVAPAGMTIDSTTGVIDWTPTAVGEATVIVKVTNGAGGERSQNFVIQVDEPALVEVPDLQGLTQTQASEALTSAGLALGTVTQANSDSVPLGAVISQVPASGASVSAQTAVDLVLSLGPAIGDLPPDPASVAPAIDPTVATTTYASTEFLYTGSNPIQTGVAPGTIEAKRAAVIRGRVLDKSNGPLPGVAITIKDHPEFGQTLSRADGWFDMAVNGGGVLTLDYARAGSLPAQRQVDVPWQDFVIAPDVVMIQLDTQVTAIDLTSSEPFQVARGSVMSDVDGQRQATILFPAGTSATMTLPGGTVQPLTTLSLRATDTRSARTALSPCLDRFPPRRATPMPSSSRRTKPSRWARHGLILTSPFPSTSRTSSIFQSAKWSRWAFMTMRRLRGYPPPTVSSSRS